MTFWATDDKWRYDVFDPDVDAAGFGTQVTIAYGEDHTGREVRDISGDFFTDIEYRLSEKIVEERIIATSTGPIRWNERGFITVSILEFPLADDGRTVDRILVLTSEI